MTKPLALLLHDRPMPGSELATRFEELDYRVVIIADPAELAAAAEREKPMVVVADLTSRRGDVLAAIAGLGRSGATVHVPVIAYGPREDQKLRVSVERAGARVVATDPTIVPHLAQFLAQALEV